MMIPLWALYALGAALCVTGMMLTQERLKADPYALSIWSKILAILCMIPLVWHAGLPQDSRFYIIMAIAGIVYAVSDIVYFRALTQIGSGLVSRILPASIVIAFLIWLAVDHSLLQHYLERPWQAAGIGFSLILAAFSASCMKKCPVSWAGIKLIWFTLFAACVGPVIVKLGLNEAAQAQATYAFVLVISSFMVVFQLVYIVARRPVSIKTILSRRNIGVSFLIGIFYVVSMILRTRALVLVDNPAYVSMLLFTDSLWIILIYKIMGRKENSHVWAGLGIVASAVLLVYFKSL